MWKTSFLFVYLATLLIVSALEEWETDFDEDFFRKFEEEAFNFTLPRDANATDGGSSIEGPDLKCIGCEMGVGLLLSLHHKGSDPTTFLKAANFLCSAVGIESKPVCRGFVNSVGRDLFAILDQTGGVVKAIDICGMALVGNCAVHSDRINDWKLEIEDLDLKPPTRSNIWPKSVPKAQKILHLSDLHVQLSYTAGANAECGLPMCCDPNDFKYFTASEARFLSFHPANEFGEYHCDLPAHTLDLMLQEIARQHPDIDYIFMTGDFPAHDTWKQSRDEILESTQVVVDLVTRSFPNTTVYPAIGNHESCPVNMFPDSETPGKYNPSWLYQKLAEMYQHWLPGEQQQDTMKDSGYYTVLLRPGLRVISMNTNFCNNFNFWLLTSFKDPHGHLHWLYRQLHKAELMKEKVFILGHIPPGSSGCLLRWSNEYSRLIHRFRNTVIGQFFGHTHTDEFEIFFGSDDPEATDRDPENVLYMAPSQTPIDGVNPAYRIYIIDGDHENTTNLILDHETYWMNLTETQISSEVRFELEYKAIRDLNLTDMSPDQWYNYVQRMAENLDDFENYRERYARWGPRVEGHCDKTCRIQMLCDLVTANSMEIVWKNQECKDIDRKITYHNENSYSWWDYLLGGGS